MFDRSIVAETEGESSTGRVGDWFRHEYGRLVAMLCYRFGPQHLEDIEDAVMQALARQLSSSLSQHSEDACLPDDLSRWLYRVACNGFLDAARASKRHAEILERQVTAYLPAMAGPPADVDLPVHQDPEASFEKELENGQLYMLFVCCDSRIPELSQLILALNILCGFEVKNLSQRLFLTPATVYKKLGRAKALLRDLEFDPSEMSPDSYGQRLPSVLRILYLMFSEGYLSLCSEHSIRKDFCTDALQLMGILCRHSVGKTPECSALMSLMCFQFARLDARRDADGGLLLLDEQDRGRWNQGLIQQGLKWLTASAFGDHFSRYHAEASIAAEHALAPSFEATRWDRVVQSYELLEASQPSAVHRLNKALALAEAEGPDKALALLDDERPPGWLQASYMWSAVRADLLRRTGALDEAKRVGQTAVDLAPTGAIRRALTKRLKGRS
jgi:predicted RNA polymerase sigma factor